MATAALSMPSACAVDTCPAPKPSFVERRMARLARGLRHLAHGTARLDEALPGSAAFHAALRDVELTEEAISSALHAILHAQVLSWSDLHLRQFGWKLRLALSIEDGADAAYTVDQIYAFPDLLYLPRSFREAGRVNALVGSCLDALEELQAQTVPALQALRGGGLTLPPGREPVPLGAVAV